MKKFVLPILSVLLLASCTKEEKKESVVPEVDSTMVAAEIPEEKPQLFVPVEYSPKQASELLNQKKNDTLYVTNFFATWCGPCVREIPHFKEKMEELKTQPVKFTFISLDNKTDWDVDVKNFVEENGIAPETILLDGNLLDEQFFASNFKTWKGETIPFTYLKKGDKTLEINGSVSKKELTAKLVEFGLGKAKNETTVQNSAKKPSDKKMKLDDNFYVGTIGQEERID